MKFVTGVNIVELKEKDIGMDIEVIQVIIAWIVIQKIFVLVKNQRLLHIFPHKIKLKKY